MPALFMNNNLSKTGVLTKICSGFSSYSGHFITRVCSFLKKIKNKSIIDSPGGAHLAQRDTVYSGK